MWRFAIQLPCEIHVHMIDVPREASLSARQEATRAAHRGTKKKIKKRISEAIIVFFTCQGDFRMTTTKGDGRPTRKTTLVSWSRVITVISLD